MFLSGVSFRDRSRSKVARSLEFRGKLAAVTSLFTLFAIFTAFVPSLAWGAAACEPLRTQDTPMSVQQQLRITNCERIVNNGSVPNQAAFSYAIRYLAENQNALKDPSCAFETASDDTECAVCQSSERIRRGIQNGCTFLLNDLERPWGDGTTRTTGYFIDLCATDPSQTVSRLKINTGTGARYNDRGGARSTLAGAFLMDDGVRNFTPYNPRPYGEMRRSLGGRLPVVRLLGLNSSNNTTDYDKPMHVSPFRTSWGCPSVGAEAVPFMRRLAENGPSLLMNYAGEQFEQRGNSCINSTEAGQSAPRQPTRTGKSSG